MESAVGTSTFAAAAAARDALVRAAHAAGRGDERVMAATARAAVFEEALLGAIKARIAEFKSVVK